MPGRRPRSAPYPSRARTRTPCRRRAAPLGKPSPPLLGYSPGSCPGGTSRRASGKLSGFRCGWHSAEVPRSGSNCRHLAAICAAGAEATAAPAVGRQCLGPTSLSRSAYQGVFCFRCEIVIDSKPHASPNPNRLVAASRTAAIANAAAAAASVDSNPRRASFGSRRIVCTLTRLLWAMLRRRAAPKAPRGRTWRWRVSSPSTPCATLPMASTATRRSSLGSGPCPVSPNPPPTPNPNACRLL
mmetsp:Transcript_15445/g.42577  ORF Transcript_15445/g.42577 Transcript_15445/m.42577 type:complete len:242 (-) Transcript_15445:1830-2555(-)